MLKTNSILAKSRQQGWSFYYINKVSAGNEKLIFLHVVPDMFWIIEIYSLFLQRYKKYG